MSKVKNRSILIMIMLALFSFFLFGCDDKVGVESIYFSEEDIVLLEGETYSPNIIVEPTYASNKAYTITSLDTRIVSVEDNELYAVAEGTTTIKVTAKDNPLKDDLIKVIVRHEQVKLTAPNNLNYNKDTQTFSFDTVEGAVGYQIRINDTSFELGNVTRYSLKDYDTYLRGHGLSAYDRNLRVDVKALKPKYTTAYIDSEYCGAIFVHQAKTISVASIEGGVLDFDKLPNSTNYRIDYVSELGTVTLATTDNATLDLTNLDERFAGTTGVIKVYSLVNDEKKTDSSVRYYDSLAYELNVKVLDSADIDLSATIMKWQDLGVGSYNIYQGSNRIATITSREYDLNSYSGIDDITHRGVHYDFRVEPVLTQADKNTLKTSKKSNSVYINRLETPIIRLENNSFVWDAVENATAYNITLTYTHGGVPRKMTALVTDTEFSLYSDMYPSDTEYSLTVYAVNTETLDSLSYLNSFEDSLTIKKQNQPEPVISNYHLIIADNAGDKYRITIDDTANTYELTAIGGRVDLDLTNMEFSAGEHRIEVVHLGDSVDSIDSKSNSITFTQYEGIDEINITDNQVSVTRSTLNADATIRLNIKGVGVDYSVDATETTLNSTLTDAENYLPAGEYVVSVYVIGDGQRTFSVRNAGELSASATKEFKVLPAPTISTLSKDMAKLNFSSVEDSAGYEIIEYTSEDELHFSVDNTSFTDFEVGEGETVTFAVRAKGDGSTTLDSILSTTMSVYRLTTPSTQFDNTTGAFSTPTFAEGEEGYIQEYQFMFNASPVEYNFTEAFNGLESGGNDFTLQAIAIEGDDTHSYLNSFEFNITIDKIDETSQISVNTDNQLLIAPSNQDREFEFSLTIETSENTFEFTASGNKLIASAGGYELDYSYVDGVYTINLLGADFKPIVREIEGKLFKVHITYLANGQTDMANSETASSVDIAWDETTSFNMSSRDEQYVVFNNIESWRTFSDYALLVNDGFMLTLDENTIVDSDTQTLKVDIEYIYNNVPSEILADINTVAVITLNTDSTDTTPKLSVVSESIQVALSAQLVLTSSKDNTSDNNSVVISFETSETDYDKIYLVDIYTKLDGVIGETKQLRFTDESSAGGKISFDLDKFITELSGEIYLTAHISASGVASANGKTVYVFNSAISNELHFTKIDTVSDTHIDKGVLRFEPVDNAIGYDIYREDGVNLEKLNKSGIITNNFYQLSDMEGDFTIRIKAISITGEFTNANMSDAVNVHKFATPKISVRDGNIVVTLSSTAIEIIQNTQVQNDDVSILNGAVLHINNGVKDIYLTTKDKNVELDGDSLIIDPSILINYGITSLVKERLTFEVSVDYSTEEVYYLNSNKESFEVYGLFEPNTLNKTTSSEGADEYIEHISWNANANNVLDGQPLTYGYVAKIVRDNNEYLTNDSRLKYKVSDSGLSSYPSVLLSENFIFPYGYDDNENGEIDEAEIFGAGVYRISVRSVPKTITNYNLVSSKYSTEYVIEIMQSPSLVTNRGVVEWQGVRGATSYYIRIYDLKDESVLATTTQTECSFDFSSSGFTDYVGVYGISVQALSNNKTIVNSKESAIFEIFRMNEVSSVEVDDGRLIINANAYFSEAEIEFVDTDGGRTETLYYINPNADENLSRLGIIKWTGLSTENQLLLQEPVRHVVSISDSEILNIMANRGYNVNIRLFGNSLSFTGIVNSKQTLVSTNLNAVKLSSGLYQVSRGVFSYSVIGEYADLDINYDFDTGDATTTDTFWRNILVYEVGITTSNRSFKFMTIDYDKFIEAVNSGLIASDKYTLITDKNDLYALVKFTSSDDKVYQFNIYKDNRIDLRNYDYLYYYPFEDSGESWLRVDFGAGGSFVVNVTLIGGDSKIIKSGDTITSHRAYLTANTADSKQFVRYKDINSTISTYDGILIFDDLLDRDDEGNIIDFPVYKLTFTPINTTNTRAVYIYYAQGGEAYARSLVTEDDAILVEADFNAELNTSIRFDMSQYFEAGTYLVDIRTLAGEGNLELDITSDYLLNARVPTINRTIYKISSSTVSVVEGKITIDMGTIDVNNASISEYEVTLSTIINDEMTDFICYINRHSEGVTFDNVNNRIIYELPPILMSGSNTFVIANGQTYYIKVRGMARENRDIVNATYLDTYSFTLSQGVSNIRIEDGKLKWQVIDRDNYLQSDIKVEFIDEYGQTKCIKIPTTGTLVDSVNNEYEYTFADTGYAVDSTGTRIVLGSNVEYSISIRTLGRSNLVDSNYSDAIPARRLHEVPADSIMSSDGVLKWEMFDGTDKFVVSVYNSDNTYTYTTKSNVLDFKVTADDTGRMLPAGEYTIAIRAIGTSELTAIRTTASQTFARLDMVSDITIGADLENFVSWTGVNKAQGYLVQFMQNGELISETTILSSEGTRADIPDNLVGRFTIRITAVGVEEGFVFNGDYAEYTGSFERPDAVSGVVYDRENNRYYFRANDFLAGDKLRIRFDLLEYVYNNSSVETIRRPTQVVEYTYNNAPYYVDDEGLRYYYFAPSTIGDYTNLSVQVDRNGLYSATSPGENLRFDIFGFGDGSAEKPYGINTLSHLLAVEKYSTAHFTMYGAVDISNLDINARIDSVGAIIASNFSGVFDGNNRAIYGLDNINLTNKTNFALFNNLNNATIKNLNFGVENNTMTITDTFDSATSEVIKLSMVAMNSTNSTLENIMVRETKFVLSSGVRQLRGGVYIAGLVANANNTTILGSLVNVSVQFDAIATGDSYVGGLVGYANGLKVGSSSTRASDVIFSISQNRSNTTINYVGGVVGFMNGGSLLGNGVYDTNVDIQLTSNIYVSAFGGVAGFANNTVIENNTITGAITHTGMMGNVNLGGIVGMGQDISVTACEIDLAFNLTISNSTSLSIGAVAGYLTASDNGACVIDSCVISTEFTTKTEYTGNEISIMGIYGNVGNQQINITIKNCSKR